MDHGTETKMNTTLAKRTALVFGASSGIGQATAIALADAGVRVAISARRQDRLEALAFRMASSAADILAFAGDVSDEIFARDTVAAVIQTWGQLDILVNSAGIIQAGQVGDADIPVWRRVMDVNFYGTLHACRAALPHMCQRGRGDIINISSIAARRLSSAHFAAYAPSKHALNSMSEALRQEAGAKGVRVSVIEPGATSTEVAEGMTDAASREMMRAFVGQEDAVLPEDIAAAIVYIASQPARLNISEMLIRPTSDVLPL
jgi:NADP-dependent 3-hydroxy acid dehydrogenase YdfG